MYNSTRITANKKVCRYILSDEVLIYKRGTCSFHHGGVEGGVPLRLLRAAWIRKCNLDSME